MYMFYIQILIICLNISKINRFAYYIRPTISYGMNQSNRAFYFTISVLKMKLLYSVALLGFLIQGTAAIETSDLVGSGVAQEIANVIPSPEDLFTASKEILFALPETSLSETITVLCKFI